MSNINNSKLINYLVINMTNYADNNNEFPIHIE